MTSYAHLAAAFSVAASGLILAGPLQAEGTTMLDIYPSSIPAYRIAENLCTSVTDGEDVLNTACYQFLAEDLFRIGTKIAAMIKDPFKHGTAMTIAYGMKEAPVQRSAQNRPANILEQNIAATAENQCKMDFSDVFEHMTYDDAVKITIAADTCLNASFTAANNAGVMLPYHVKGALEAYAQIIPVIAGQLQEHQSFASMPFTQLQ